MIIKNSVRQLFRTPVKTTLFVALLAATTTFICFGINMWLSVNTSLELAGNAFSTIGVIEYSEPFYFADYRNSKLDLSPISDSKYVELFDHRTMIAGYTKDINITREIQPLKTGHRFSVIEFTPLEIASKGEQIKIDGQVTTITSHTKHAARIKILNVGYTSSSHLKAGNVTILEFPNEYNFTLETGKRYITGGFFESASFTIHDNLWAHVGILGPTSGHFGRSAVIMEITEDNYLESGDGLFWARLIKTLENSLHTLAVYTTNGIETMLAFHQGNALITNGRSFTKDDYEKGNPVCIISSRVATRNNLQPGDTISISFHEAKISFLSTDAASAARRNNLKPGDTLHEKRVIFLNTIARIDAISPTSASVDQGDYEIIGVYQLVTAGDSSYDLYEDTAFIPQNAVSHYPDNLVIFDNAVSFRLTNGTVEAFLMEMEQYDLPGISFTIYDQGYAKITAVLADMKQTALFLTAICASAGLGIVLLFSLLFVGRQKRNIAIMYSLGTSRRKSLGFLMVTVLIVSGLAVSIGGLAGYVLSDTVLADVYAKNLEEQTQAAYSGVYGSDVEADFQINSPNGPIAPVAAAGSVLALTLLLSSLFAIKVLKAEPMQVLTEKED